MSLKQIEKVWTFDEKEKKAKQKYVFSKSKDTKSRHRKRPKPSSTAAESMADSVECCMVRDGTEEEENGLLIGRLWVECGVCQKWIHEECIPSGVDKTALQNNDDFVCHSCLA